MEFLNAYFRYIIFMVFGKLQKALAGTFQNLFSPGNLIHEISRRSESRIIFNKI